MSKENEPLVAPSGIGRSFAGHRKVRLGDVRPSGRLRFDALTRYTQDVSNDDTSDATLPDDMAWVVRRTTVDVIGAATFGEGLDITTFCSGLGRRWAERRLHIEGEHGAHYEVATLWVHLDEETGRPRPLGDTFLEIYAEASQGRQVSARLAHETAPDQNVQRSSWPIRAVDMDLFDHMNNAAYWSCIEELLPGPAPGRPYRCTIEYRDGIAATDAVELLHRRSGDLHLDLWWLVSPGGPEGRSPAVAATAQLRELRPGLYD